MVAPPVAGVLTGALPADTNGAADGPDPPLTLADGAEEQDDDDFCFELF